MGNEKSGLVYINYIILFIIAGSASVLNTDIYMIGVLGITIYSTAKIVINKFKEESSNKKKNVLYLIAAIVEVFIVCNIAYYVISYVQGCQFTV